MVNKNLYTLLVCLLLAGCDLIDYHPYDVRISGETDVNAHNIEQIEANQRVSLAAGHHERTESALCRPYRES